MRVGGMGVLRWTQQMWAEPGSTYLQNRDFQTVAMVMLTCTSIHDAITANSGSFFLPTPMLNTWRTRPVGDCNS